MLILPGCMLLTSRISIYDRFLVSNDNTITDIVTGLQWRVGPDRDFDWFDAGIWVASLGGNWRLPYHYELDELYDANITTLTWGPFDNTGWRPKKRLPVAKELGETSLMFLVHPTLLSLEIEKTGQAIYEVMQKAMENPAVVSFIGNIGPVFVTLMGILLLRERFRTTQVIGIVITIMGIFVINFREGGFAGFFDPGSVYVLSAAFLFSLATIVGRRMHHMLVPGYMSLIRSFLLAVVMALLFFRTDVWPSIPLNIWKDLALGSLLETLIVIVFAYQALKLIEATKTSLLISTKGVWTLVLAWIFLGVFPTGVQLVGGLLTLVGVWLITWTRRTTHQE